MSEPQDERLGLPSASTMKRTRRCPGWLRLALSLPRCNDSTKDSNVGESRHSLIEIDVDADTIEDTNEAYTVGRAQQLRDQALAAMGWADGTYDVYTETRLWLHNDSLELACSARLDWLAIHESGCALVQDYKTLFGDHGAAKTNEQLMTAATIVHDCFGSHTVRCALIQPNLSKERQLTQVEYEENDLRWARADVLRWCADGASPCAPRIPGPVQCEHCPCRADCPEAIAAKMAITVAKPLDVSDPSVLAVLLDSADLADRVVKQIRDKAKRMLESGVEIPGWGLKAGAEQRKLTDASKVAGALYEAGATQEEITAIAKFGVTDVDKLYKAKTGLKQVEARQQLEARLIEIGAMEKSQKAASLIRSK